MPMSHRLDVEFADHDLHELALANVSLYAFLGFESSNETGVALVFRKFAPAAVTSIVWTEAYNGFVSRITLAEGAGNAGRRTLTPDSVTPVVVGQSLTVPADDLDSTLANDGQPNGVTFRSCQQREISCGLGYGTPFASTCAFALAAGVEVTVAPLQFVYLMLSSSPFDVGSWVDRTQGQGLIVDMTGTDRRSVAYDSAADPVWQAADGSLIYPIPGGEPLNGLLRRPPGPNVPHLRRSTP